LGISSNLWNSVDSFFSKYSWVDHKVVISLTIL